MYSKSEQEAIEEKVSQLQDIVSGLVSSRELADIITQRRVTWYEENRDLLNSRYIGFPDEEKAYRVIFFDHMHIDPERSVMSRIEFGRIKIESHNFCPYLEACNILNLDTRIICKEIGEPSIQRVCGMINPKLEFSRNYRKIRPYNEFYCEEYIVLH